MPEKCHGFVMKYFYGCFFLGITETAPAIFCKSESVGNLKKHHHHKRE